MGKISVRWATHQAFPSRGTYFCAQKEAISIVFLPLVSAVTLDNNKKKRNNTYFDSRCELLQHFRPTRVKMVLPSRLHHLAKHL